jgi:peptidoglycan/LPS O-acetylase OafA/YrhL
MGSVAKTEPLGWRPGLDGLRGAAVLAVVLYHIEATHSLFPGGSLGVDIFFVLSGFLITTLLLEERTKVGAVALAGFYERRARRLLPALIAFLAAFALITVVTGQPGVGDLPLTLSTSLLYVFNWVDDFGGTATPGAGHLWSLSVEEQFYLVWPLALIVAMRYGRKSLLATSVAVFAIAASLPLWSGRGYGEMYSGTDFRSQELMAGAILAQLRLGGVITPAVTRSIWFRGALVAALAFFCTYLLTLNDRDGFLYAGMYTLVAVFGAVIVCAALYAPTPILTNRLIRYVGTRSYALYLWHHAIAYWLLGIDAVPQVVLVLALSFAAAELSWWLVETRDSAAFRLARRVRLPQRPTPATVPGPATASTPPAS